MAQAYLAPKRNYSKQDRQISYNHDDKGFPFIISYALFCAFYLKTIPYIDR